MTLQSFYLYPWPNVCDSYSYFLCLKDGVIGGTCAFMAALVAQYLTSNNREKEGLMSNRSFIAFGAVLLVVSMGLAFYWYEYRPSQIRAACEMHSSEQAAEFFRKMMGKQAPKGFPEGFYIQSNKENFYLNCVREHGLER